MNKIILDDLLVNGNFFPGLHVGLLKRQVEDVLGKNLNEVYLKTPDLTCYVVEIKPDFFLNLYFDQNDVCYEIRLDFKENKELMQIIQSEEISDNISFEDLIDILMRSDTEWEFDPGRMYLQTICVRITSGLRFYYAFGDKRMDDYGLFSITEILEPHVLTRVGTR